MLDYADPNTPFARTAKEHGIPAVPPYDYPPTLADLLAPLTVFSPSVAFIVWYGLGLVMILSASVMLARSLGIESLSQTTLIAVLLILFRPTLATFSLGQVSILLLFLLMAGVTLYLRGRKNVAGLMFALAAAIKLTPLILIVPFLAWRDWKILRATALWVAAILGALWIINGIGTLNLYFFHVLPAMSNGIVDLENRSLESMFQIYGHRSFQGTTSIGLTRAARIISALVVCYAAWLSQSNSKENLLNDQKLEIISIFLLLSCCVAPVSWTRAYVLSAPILIVLGTRIWQRRSNTYETALLVLFLFSLSFSRGGYFLVATPLFGIALGIMRLRGLRTERLRDQPDGEPAAN